MAVQMPPKCLVAYQNTCGIMEFSNDVLVKVLRDFRSTNDFNAALYQLWQRSHLWWLSLSKLDNPGHIQAACACCRAQLELLVDAKYLIKLPSEAARYIHYPEVSTLSQANKIKKLISEGKAVHFPEGANALLKDTARVASITELENKYFAKGGMETWSGKNFRIRCQEVGMMDEYLSDYYYLSVNVHSGSLGPLGETPEVVADVYYYAHVSALHYYAKVIKTVLYELKPPAYAAAVDALCQVFCQALARLKAV